MSTQSDHRSLTEFSDLAEFTAAEGSDTPAAVSESVMRYVA
jgi:hypothetical protein